MVEIHEIKQHSKINETITRREFLQRIGDSKYSELLNIAESDNLIKARLDILNADKNVWLLSPEYTQWFSDLVNDNVITQDEFNKIFEVQ